MTDQIIEEFAYHDHAVPQGKKAVLLLMWTVFPPHCYIVKAISATTYYKPGDRLTEAVVKQINELPDWDIQTVGDDIINAITNTVGAAVSIKAVPGLF